MMVISKLQSMTDDELYDLSESKGIPVEEFDREFAIEALATFPENDNIEKYMATIAVGDLVAFRTSSYKVKSAIVVRKSSSDEKLMLETKYGKQFFIGYEDVVWVNTNGYWPKWVYNLMKGNENAEAEAYTD